MTRYELYMTLQHVILFDDFNWLSHRLVVKGRERMKRLLLWAACLSLFFTLSDLFAGGGTKKLQMFHRKIGNGLIKIKKIHPDSQSLIYSLLDQMSKYYSFSKEIFAKKDEYKKLLQAELASSDTLQKENEAINGKMTKMKKAVLFVNNKVEKEAGEIETLRQKNKKLEQVNDELEVERDRLVVEKGALCRERDALIREKDALAREKELLTAKKELPVS